MICQYSRYIQVFKCNYNWTFIIELDFRNNNRNYFAYYIMANIGHSLMRFGNFFTRFFQIPFTFLSAQ